jgi:septum formation protein
MSKGFTGFYQGMRTYPNSLPTRIVKPFSLRPAAQESPMTALPEDTPLILASSSTARRQLLTRLTPNFSCCSPDIDESALPGESPVELCRRLALAKARAVQDSGKQGLIISSDQVAMLGDQQLCKPMTHENTVQQLLACQGRTVQFYTSVCVLNTRTSTHQLDHAENSVHFRKLERERIEQYVHKEQPFYCAGGFMIEGLGIALFNAIEGADPNALIGLSLLKLVSMLENEGWRAF